MITRPIIVGAIAPKANGSIFSKIVTISLASYHLFPYKHSMCIKSHQPQVLPLVTFASTNFWPELHIHTFLCST
jgi:hypothetical protein